MNLSRTQPELGLNRLEVTNMIQNRMSCDSVTVYYDRSMMAYNYDVTEECQYLDTLRNNGFKIIKSSITYHKWKKKGKWYRKFKNYVWISDISTRQRYDFYFDYVPNLDKWCLTSINKYRF